MIDPQQLKHNIIIPSLLLLSDWTEKNMAGRGAVALCLGTCAQESDMGRYLKQLGTGPAMSIYQIEPATEKDVWHRFIRPKGLASHFQNKFGEESHVKLIEDLSYATMICRLKYWMCPGKLPSHDDVEGLAQYWKKWYNTPKGKGLESEFITNFNKYQLYRFV